MRIVAGRSRGRTLKAPAGSETRPTSDKVRAAIFNVLGQFFSGGRVLDLYAGTGAMALEALSRGCASATCVESSKAGAACIRANADACGFGRQVEIRCERVEQALGRMAGPFDLVFLDPPYGEGPETALARLEPVLRKDGLAVAEHDVRQPPGERYGRLTLVERRVYGRTGVSIYRLG